MRGYKVGGEDHLSMILIMSCRSAGTFDKEVNYLDGPESSLGYWKQEREKKPIVDHTGEIEATTYQQEIAPIISS